MNGESKPVTRPARGLERVLDGLLHAGLGAGHLGVVLARAGVGKTALLVRIGLDEALHDRPVLHVALGQSLEHVIGWYDALFEDLEERALSAASRQRTATNGDGNGGAKSSPFDLRERVSRRRTIQALPDARLTVARLRQVTAFYAEHMSLVPAVILIDGYLWPANEVEVHGLKQIASELGAELWMSAQTHAEQPAIAPNPIPPPCARFAKLVDVALELTPQGEEVRVSALKDHAHPMLPASPLRFDPRTMRFIGATAPNGVRRPQAVTLLSGGAAGAEAAFGEEAERWGVKETNYSFAGRQPSRQVSVVELPEDALRRGEVSVRYLETHLKRSFPDTPEFHKLLQTIWHQVATAEQVFVIGAIQADGTVRGGTGWAAELAKHLRKPVFVFDQNVDDWRAWQDGGWREIDPPRIEAARFCGTGTRNLTPGGREAIAGLFSRSFASG